MGGEKAESPRKSKWGKTVKISLGVLGGLSLLMGYISATGMQDSEREGEARRSVDDLLRALNANDEEAARQALQFPHIRVVGNDVIVWEQADDYRIDSDWLGTAELWSEVRLNSCILRQDSDDKLHFEVQFSTLDPHATQSFTYKSFWIVTSREGRWGIQSISTFPEAIRVRNKRPVSRHAMNAQGGV
jgi:hypothetical protein